MNLRKYRTNWQHFSNTIDDTEHILLKPPSYIPIIRPDALRKRQSKCMTLELLTFGKEKTGFVFASHTLKPFFSLPFFGSKDIKTKTDEQVKKIRDDFNQGSVHVFIQGLSCGCKNWSAVPVNPSHHILHILPHGNSFHNIMLRQAVSRTNRIVSHGKVNVLMFCSSVDDKDMLKNIEKFYFKEERVAKLQQTQDALLPAEGVDVDIKQDIERSRERLSKGITKESYIRVAFDTDKENLHFVSVDGAAPLKSLSVNMKDTVSMQVDRMEVDM